MAIGPRHTVGLDTDWTMNSCVGTELRPRSAMCLMTFNSHEYLPKGKDFMING